MTYEEIYEKKFDDFYKGKITLKEWDAFCTQLLYVIMEQNQDILKRLKGEW